MVHDFPALGLLLLARTQSMADKLKAMFKERQVTKKYWLITKGVPNPYQGNFLLHFFFFFYITLHETKLTCSYLNYNEDCTVAYMVLHVLIGKLWLEVPLKFPPYRLLLETIS